MSQKAMPMAMPTPHLPEEIMMDILSRLPVKSLLRFRCVSKSWLNLISSPQFVKLHLNRSTALKNQRVLVSTSPLQSIDYDGGNSVTELDCPIRNPDCDIEILGSCDGLVCLFDEEYISVYNPSTRKFRELPQPPEIENALPFADMFHGFGYDSSVDDYKLVGGRRTNSGDTKFVEFNIKGNFWRSIGELLRNSYRFRETSGAFVNGALHWLATRGTGPDRDRVIVRVSLDLAHKVFEEIPLPDCDQWKSPIIGFRVLGDCLSVLLEYDGISFEVWWMREYGVKASWEKLITISHRVEDYIVHYLIPLCFLVNGELLVEINSSYLVMYNAEQNVFRDVTIRGDPDWFLATLYVESLVSPHGL